MRRSRRHQQGLQSEMNIVPYVDVMFVLLTIFMVTATTISVGVEIDEPVLETDVLYSDVDLEKDPYVLFAVNAEGQYYLPDSDNPDIAMSLNEVVENIVNQYGENSGVKAYLRTDKETPYIKIIEAMGKIGDVTGEKVTVIVPQGEA